MDRNIFFGGIKPNINKPQAGSSGKSRLRRRPNLEFTENPRVRRSSFTSDDDSFSCALKAPKINPILASSESSQTPQIQPQQKPQQQQQQQPQQRKPPSFDTVITSPGLCTRLSSMRVEPLQEINPRTPVRKSLNFDTVVDTSDDDEDPIEVLDSEDESELSRLQPANTSASFINCSSTIDGHSDFFNNVPHASHAVSHSMVRRGRAVRRTPPPIEHVNVINRSLIEESDDESDKENHVEIGPTDDEAEEELEIGPTDDELEIESRGGTQVKKGTRGKKALQTDKNAEVNKRERGAQLGGGTQVKGGTKNKVLDKSAEVNKREKGAQVKALRGGTKLPVITPTNDKAEADTESEEVVDLTLDESPIEEQPRINRNLHTPGVLSAQFASPKSSTGKKSALSIKIKLDLKISVRTSDSSSESESESESEEEEEVVGSVGNCLHTPKDTGAIEIDGELQELLTSLYGDGWKTPQLLRSCKSKKFRESLRRSLHANNFDSFMKNLPIDFDSTRISPTDLSQPTQTTVKPKMLTSAIHEECLNDENQQSGKKKKEISSTKSKSTPQKPTRNKKTPKSTPGYLDICDPDTPSSSSSGEDDDDEFNANDTWNASSDEEYASEKDRIAKRQSVIRASRRFDEIVFVKDASVEEEKKFDDILKRGDFKKPPIIKRKLFNPAAELEEEEEEKIVVKKVEDKKEEKKIEDKKEEKREKKVENKKKEKDQKKVQKTFSFLKSLDLDVNPAQCDPEALTYRTHYRTKKQELAERLFRLYNEKVFNSQLASVPIRWNRKLLTTGGRCNNSRRGGVRGAAIELSDKVLTSPDRLRCTLIHEMCHAAAWLLEGANGHGCVWRRYTASARHFFPELPAIKVCHSYVIEYRYTYLCVDCKARSLAHSKSRKAHEVRCSICHGAIQLFENKRNEHGEVDLVPVQKREATGFAKFVKLKFREVKTPYMSHQQVMKMLSAQFQSLSVEERAML